MEYEWLKILIEHKLLASGCITLLATLVGALLAFASNYLIEFIKNRSFQLKKLRAYCGSLLSTLDGYVFIFFLRL